jgi:hypothetical protein
MLECRGIRAIGEFPAADDGKTGSVGMKGLAKGTLAC